MRALVALVALAACSQSVAQETAGYELECTFTEKRQCQPGQACTDIEPRITARVDTDGSRYQRCDTEGCNVIPVNLNRSGIWTLLEAPGRGMFAKVSDGGEILEIATLNMLVLVSYGQCRRL